MNKKRLKLISNLIFGISTLVALFTLVKVGQDYYLMYGTGVCVISKNHNLVYLSLALLFVSMIVTSVLDAKAKKMPDEAKNDIYDQTLETFQKADKKDAAEEGIEDGIEENAQEKQIEVKSEEDKA